VTAGVVQCFSRLLKSSQIDLVEQAVWGLGNIAGDSVMHRDMLINLGLVPVITDLLSRVVLEKSTFVRNASWTLSNLCRQSPRPETSKIIYCVKTLCQVINNNLDNNEIVHDVIWALSCISDSGKTSELMSDLFVTLNSLLTCNNL
jgi:hypothetical protein